MARVWVRLRRVLDPLTARNFAIDAGAGGLFAVFQALTAPFISVVAVRRGAVPWEVGLLAAAPCAAMLLSTWYARLAARGRLVPLVAWSTGAARCLLLATAWAHGLGLYIGAYVGFNLLTAASNPAYTAIEHAIYRQRWRGRLMAGVRTILGFFQFAAMLAAGRLMDRYGPGPVFSAAVVFGVASSALFALVRLPPRPQPQPQPQPQPAAPVRVGAVALARSDPRFGRLILAVMLAGGGNLLVQPGYPLAQVHRLHLSDAEVSLLAAAWAMAWTICYPLWGRLCDRRRPAQAIALGFACYLVPPLCYALGGGLHALLLAGVLQGVGDSALDAGWQNHVMRLGGERTGQYAGAYFTFLGIRGTAAPLLGAAIISRFGLVALFVSGIVLVAAGLAVARHLPDAPLDPGAPRDPAGRPARPAADPGV